MRLAFVAALVLIAAALAGVALNWPAEVLDRLVAATFALALPELADRLTLGGVRSWFAKLRFRWGWIAVYALACGALYGWRLGWPSTASWGFGAAAFVVAVMLLSMGRD